ncbi:MAG TPA: DUF1501 domain-containing protein, partial [Tepidisphaeraceae bacterium]
MIFSRRQFLKTGASVLAIGSAVPTVLMNLAQARGEENNKSTDGRILVIFELNGGNDGLNTVIPITDAQYPLVRPTLAIPQGQVLMLDDKVGLHPAMSALHDLYKNNQLAVIQGAGYPNANRSHFRSMEIWHRGDPGKDVNTGWLGRYYEQAAAAQNKSVVPIVHYGQQRPEIFRAGRAPAMSVNAVDDFYPMGQKPESVAISTLYKDMKKDAPDMPADDMHTDAKAPEDVIESTGQDIVKGTEIIKAVLKHPRQTRVNYPKNDIGRGFAVFAQMIIENHGTKLFYINIGGFDTHAKQAPGHAAQLGLVSAAIGAFLADLKTENRDKDVLVMSFSEFGRRVHENASAGTDHGAASV